MVRKQDHDDLWCNATQQAGHVARDRARAANSVKIVDAEAGIREALAVCLSLPLLNLTFSYLRGLYTPSLFLLSPTRASKELLRVVGQIHGIACSKSSADRANCHLRRAVQ